MERTLQDGETYPVLAINPDAAAHECREQGKPYSLLEQLGDVAERVLDAGKITLWAREAQGLDKVNQPALLIFVLVVGTNDGMRTAGELRDALSAVWGDWAVQLEGETCPVGDETVVWPRSAAEGATYEQD